VGFAADDRAEDLIGAVLLYTDWSVPVDRLRQELQTVVRASPLWDGRTAVLQVTDVTNTGLLEIRALVSASNASRLFDLRCEVREKLVGFVQAERARAAPPALS
jgi:hypothetical protein